MKEQILLIEGKRQNHNSFAAGLTKKGYLVSSVASGAAALKSLKDGLPSLVVIDASSMRTNGKRICQSLRLEAPQLPIILILDDHTNYPNGCDANVILHLPFTLQKLVNRIRHQLPKPQKSSVEAGPIKMDTETRWVTCLEKQVHLTPRLMCLLKNLMDHPGEVIDREALFREVWETDYTADTRSLDVHISWLRQALEEDPRHPKFIKTIRGVGYRLDVEPAVRPRTRRVPYPKDPPLGE